MNDHRHGKWDRVALRREAFIAFAGAIALSLSLSALLGLARLAGLRPLLTVDALDEQLAQRLIRPPIRAGAGVGAPTVIFVDVDEQTMDGYVTEHCAALDLDAAKPDASSSPLLSSVCPARNDPRWVAWSDATPRDLLARLVHVIRAHEPAVIFLDVDLRSQTAGGGDAELLAALEEEPQRFAPILLPRLVDEGEWQGCPGHEGQAALPPRAFATIADARHGRGAVFFVHPYVEVDALGYVNGVCARIRQQAGGNAAPLTLLAASELAMRLASGDPAQREADARGGGHAGDFRRVQFVVNQERVYPAAALSGGSAPEYLRISASRILRSEVSLDVLKRAVVILGTSYAGSEAAHETALGSMPGAIVHANVMLQIARGSLRAIPGWLEFLAEFALMLLLAAVYAIIHVRIGHALQLRAQGRFQGVLLRITFFALAGLVSVAIAVFHYTVLIPTLSAGSEFAALAPLLALGGELMFEVAHGVTQMSERLAERIVGSVDSI